MNVYNLNEIFLVEKNEQTRLNPLSKFSSLLIFSFSIFLIKEIFFLFIVFVGVSISFFFNKNQLKDLKRLFRFILSLQVFMLFINVFFHIGLESKPLFYVFPKEWSIIGGLFPIYREGLYLALRSPLLILTVVIPSLLFFKKTDPRKFALSLNHQLNVSIKVSQSIAIGLNFIPVIQKEISSIKASLIARGERLFISEEKKRFFHAIKTTIAFLTTLLISILRKVDNLSISLEKRGLGLYKQRTEELIKWKKKDSIIIMLSILFPVFIILHNFRIMHVPFPSIFQISSNIGLIDTINKNGWILPFFFFSFILSIIFLFILRIYKTKKKNKKNSEPLKELEKDEDEIDKKIKIANNFVEVLGEKYIKFPITAGMID